MGVVAVKVGRSLHIEARAILRFFSGVTKSEMMLLSLIILHNNQVTFVTGKNIPRQ